MRRAGAVPGRFKAPLLLATGALVFALTMVGVADVAKPARAEAKAEPKAQDDAKKRARKQGSQKGEAAGPGKRPGAAAGQGPGKSRGGRRGRPPTFVGVDPVKKGPLTQTEPVIGRIVATQRGVVAAQVAGAVVEINVAVGQHVKKGEVLARLDTSIAKAKLAFETAELKLAEQELKRFEALRANRSAAFARTRYDSAVHRLARAKANVRMAELAIAKATVKAPYDGVVVNKATELGAFVQVGAAVVELLNDTNVEIEADVPADRVSGLPPGQIITFRFREGAKPHKAKVRAILPTQNALTRTSAVRFIPVGGKGMAGQSINQAVTVEVPLGPTRVVVSVHKDAIINRGEMQMVYVVMGGKAIPRPVRLGPAIGSRFVVEGGLAPGDIVVVRGNERLRPGQSVRHRPVEGAKPAGGPGVKPGAGRFGRKGPPSSREPSSRKPTSRKPAE